MSDWITAAAKQITEYLININHNKSKTDVWFIPSVDFYIDIYIYISCMYFVEGQRKSY